MGPNRDVPTIAMPRDRSCRAYDALRQPHKPDYFGHERPEPNVQLHMPDNFGRVATPISLPEQDLRRVPH